ncbi:MAG: metal-dependent transcriptional regulator [Bdellovibrionales bacterium]|jgi:DtxR family transcriptional regulator, Mn-dependent transcriptional regulator|nr:metal-dependent transcriptional regulator [Bdellovibrionales bacterium]MBT3527142.1 metal-dependent transcriptional regulator [Bdellovibrionales bacterium]MBT7669234.1 metal-dependent transcriptional regulator [Bdellovibrionales bacterium]
MNHQGAKSEISHSVTHYLLAIHRLKEVRGFARVTDIARDLSLTKGSVSTALNNLRKRKLVADEADCKFVILTPKGHKEIHRILSARKLIFHFFRDILAVDEKNAQRDACLIEHLISTKSREKLFDFMRSISCECGQRKKHSTWDFSTKNSTLNLCDYSDIEEFISGQVPE